MSSFFDSVVCSTVNSGSARERQICHRGDGGGWFSCPGGTCPEREGRVLLKRRLHRDFRQSVGQPEDARAHVGDAREQLLHGGGIANGSRLEVDLCWGSGGEDRE